MRARSCHRLTLLGTLWVGLVAGGCDAVGPDAVIGTEVDARGGTVRSEDGRVILEVPAGAMLDAIELSIVPSDSEPHNAIGPAYAIEPFGVVFVTPALVRYDVSDCDEVHDPATLRLVTERYDRWDTLADGDLDEVRAELSASVLFAAAVGAAQ